jgi:hypothetical protein
MKVTHQIQVLIILTISIRSTITQISPSTHPSVSKMEQFVAAATAIDNPMTEVEKKGISGWLIIDKDNRWNAEEVEILKRILQNTFDALAANGIDGRLLLDVYRFRHEAGR